MDPQPSQPTDSAEDDLVREGERIERLLEDVRSIAGLPVWQRVEELVQRLVRLYGAGLGRVLDHLQQLHRLDGPLAERLAGDPLVSSLLLLHDLHPWPVLERVRRALEQAGPILESHLGPHELLGVEGDVVHLRVLGRSAVAASSVLSVERLIARVLQDAAPEIARVDVQGLRRPSERTDGPLVQIDLRRVRATSPSEKAPP